MKNGPYELIVPPYKFPGKRYRGKYAYEHIVVFWQTHGRMPKPRHVVHHANEDKRDNSPDNLEEIYKGYHIAMHNIFARPFRWVKMFCAECQGEFYRAKGQVKKDAKNHFCSKECLYKFMRIGR